LTNQNVASQLFKDHFGEPPSFVVRAPGRVNLIGEHTDYNLGYSLPMAIDLAIWIGLRPRTDRHVWVRSTHSLDPAHFSIDDIQPTDGWANYVHGMTWALRESGYQLQGWEGILASDLPIGSGLSSSAALEIGVVRAFWALSRWDWNDIAMAQVCNLNDHRWMGIKSGILDQLISAIGKQGRAFLIDFKYLTYAPAPLPKGTAVVVFDTKVNRWLAASAYNTRVEECRLAARHFGADSLREVSLKEFQARSDELDEVVRRRARHVITENDRTLSAADRLLAGDAQGFGDLMTASHTSLRDDFEVSCDELNLLVDLSLQDPDCYGARMTGAGFGGCAVALVESVHAEKFSQKVAGGYGARTGLKPDVYLCQPAQGAEVYAIS
jgi:galactokinase